MSLIRNFQEEQAARVLSSETRDTLHQWHRRRTTQRSAPSIDDFQVKTQSYWTLKFLIISNLIAFYDEYIFALVPKNSLSSLT